MIKINSLELDDVKRIRAVKLEPSESGLTIIGGKNNQGKGYFPEQMPVAKYPPDFINGVLIGAWDQVYAIIKENTKIPF